MENFVISSTACLASVNHVRTSLECAKMISITRGVKASAGSCAKVSKILNSDASLYIYIISNSILYLDTCLQLYLDVATTIRPHTSTGAGGMLMFRMVSKFEYICIFSFNRKLDILI